MTSFDQFAERIIKEQELIIGPIAWQEAEKVSGIHIDPQHANATVDPAAGAQAIDRLVSQYQHLFGKASIEVCRDAVASIIADLPSSEVPASLR